MATSKVESVTPIFVLAKNVEDSAILDATYEICLAGAKVVGSNDIVGCQKIRGLYRLYPKSVTARARILAEGIKIKGKLIPLSALNPFIVRGSDGKEIPSTRLTISEIPISVANSAIEGALIKVGVKLRSKIMMEGIRDGNGRLTEWLSGRRFAYIDLPSRHIDSDLAVGQFKGKLFYRELKGQQKCFRCQQRGHRAVECSIKSIRGWESRGGGTMESGSRTKAGLAEREEIDIRDQVGEESEDDEKVSEWESVEEYRENERNKARFEPESEEEVGREESQREEVSGGETDTSIDHVADRRELGGRSNGEEFKGREEGERGDFDGNRTEETGNINRDAEVDSIDNDQDSHAHVKNSCAPEKKQKVNEIEVMLNKENDIEQEVNKNSHVMRVDEGCCDQPDNYAKSGQKVLTETYQREGAENNDRKEDSHKKDKVRKGRCTKRENTQQITKFLQNSRETSGKRPLDTTLSDEGPTPKGKQKGNLKK